MGKNQIGAYEVFVKDFNQIEETSNEIYNKSTLGVKQHTHYKTVPKYF
ncbi:MAG: hypothetical protein CM15mP122_3960 [Bacteroidota bacterium]|nr:MAG: hypothetical protein CM15mP122_3960 [Bacteroidota bacterium]